jgi:hypothetical protein
MVATLVIALAVTTGPASSRPASRPTTQSQPAVVITRRLAATQPSTIPFVIPATLRITATTKAALPQTVEATIVELRLEAAAARADASSAAASAAKAAKSSFPWWQVIPWIIAGTAALISYKNYTQSRKPRLKIINVKTTPGHDLFKRIATRIFRVDLHSYGSDLYDLKAALIVQRGDPMEFSPIVFELKPREQLQNPVKNGQFLTFETDSTELEHQYSGKSRPLSDYPSRAISIEIKVGGNHIVKRIVGSWFWPIGRKLVAAVRKYDAPLDQIQWLNGGFKDDATGEHFEIWAIEELDGTPAGPNPYAPDASKNNIAPDGIPPFSTD